MCDLSLVFWKQFSILYDFLYSSISDDDGYTYTCVPCPENFTQLQNNSRNKCSEIPKESLLPPKQITHGEIPTGYVVTPITGTV